MPKWENGCIYMLRHKDDVELQNIYIGSTTNFRGRKYEHKKSCNNVNHTNYNQAKYQYIRANGGWDNWIMVWLEDYPCKSKRELEKKEDEVMLQYQNKLNQIRACLTDEERKQYQKEWYENNKEKKKEYYETNKEQISEYQKEYYENNKEKIKEYSKEYRDNNKEKIYEKITCDICGCESVRKNIHRHQKTIKCQSHKMSK